eukprot:gene6184-12528_t
MSADLECFRHFESRIAGLILCFAGGFVDTAGFILLNNIFCASITGNLVKIAQISLQGGDVTTYVVVTLFYGTGCGVARIIATYLKSLKNFHLAVVAIWILVSEVIFLIISMLIGYALQSLIEHPSTNVNDWPIVLTGSLIAISMGIQAGVASTVFRSFPNTTGMTASIAQTFSAMCNMILLYMRLHGVISFYLSDDDIKILPTSSDDTTDHKQQLILQQKQNEAWLELKKQGWPLVSFISGAFLGAFLTDLLKFWGLIFPQIIVLFLIGEITFRHTNHNASLSFDGTSQKNDLVTKTPHITNDLQEVLIKTNIIAPAITMMVLANLLLLCVSKTINYSFSKHFLGERNKHLGEVFKFLEFHYWHYKRALEMKEGNFLFPLRDLVKCCMYGRGLSASPFPRNIYQYVLVYSIPHDFSSEKGSRRVCPTLSKSVFFLGPCSFARIPPRPQYTSRVLEKHLYLRGQRPCMLPVVQIVYSSLPGTAEKFLSCPVQVLSLVVIEIALHWLPGTEKLLSTDKHDSRELHQWYPTSRRNHNYTALSGLTLNKIRVCSRHNQSMCGQDHWLQCFELRVVGVQQTIAVVFDPRIVISDLNDIEEFWLVAPMKIGSSIVRITLVSGFSSFRYFMR